MAKVLQLPRRIGPVAGAVDTTGETVGQSAAPPPEPPAAGAPTPPNLPEPATIAELLSALLEQSRAVTTQLVNFAPPSSESTTLTSLLHNHVTIQGNIADLQKRLQEASTGSGAPADQRYISILSDVDTVEKQVIDYTSAVAELVGASPQQAQLATTKSKKVLWFFLALGAVGVGVVAWKMTRKKRGGRPKKLLGDVDKD